MTPGLSGLMSDVSRETLAKLDSFAANVVSENLRQNLISKSTISDLWRRHILDSAQLADLVPQNMRSWLDLGTGAGFPGLVIAIVRPHIAVSLVEARPLRARFLKDQVDDLGLENVIVHARRVEKLETQHADVISARAFAPLATLLALGARFSTPSTNWVLPKGKSASDELASAKNSWQGEFRIEPSITDPDAGIIVARNVRPRAGKV